MIPKRIERKPENDNYRALALYAADAKIHGETGEKTLMSWYEGCMAEDYLGGMIEVEATQAMNTRSDKEKTYHLMVSFRPEDEAKLTPEVFKDIEKHLAKAIGFDGHQRHCGVHKNTDNMHMHVAYNMIVPKKFTRYEPYRDYPKLHRACRELEKKYGLAVDPGMEEFAPKKEAPKHVKAATIEAHTGQEAFNSYVMRHKPQIMEAVEKAGSWREVHEAFLKIGVILKERGAGLVIEDRFAADHHAKPSAIDRNLSRKKLEERFGSFMKPSREMISSIQIEDKYNAAPLHQNPNRDNLYANFQSEMKQRKAALEAVKEMEGEAYKSNKSKWDEKRKVIDNYAMLPAHKRQLLQTIKAREEAELAASRLALAERREAIRASIPYTSWTKFLQHKAAKGNETALEILRSKKIQPELITADSNDKFQTDLEATKASKEEQAAVLSMHGINQKHKRALLAVIKMRELISKETDIKNEDIQHKIDTKGVVIFTLKSGGTIRDTGKEVNFSPYDETAQSLAGKYAKMKWGCQVIHEKNSLKFDNRPKRNEMSR